MICYPLPKLQNHVPKLNLFELRFDRRFSWVELSHIVPIDMNSVYAAELLQLKETCHRTFQFAFQFRSRTNSLIQQLLSKWHNECPLILVPLKIKVKFSYNQKWWCVHPHSRSPALRYSEWRKWQRPSNGIIRGENVKKAACSDRKLENGKVLTWVSVEKQTRVLSHRHANSHCTRAFKQNTVKTERVRANTIYAGAFFSGLGGVAGGGDREQSRRNRLPLPIIFYNLYIV